MTESTVAAVVTKEFTKFPKLHRLCGPVIVTEKIDGTNAQIYIGEDGSYLVGSRTRWITPQADNFGFARWAYDNQTEITALLGFGTHYGEWWGKGIQRGYNVENRRFSLFNTARWAGVVNTDSHKPYELNATIGIYIAPFIYSGAFDTEVFAQLLTQLKSNGSYASPGFMNPEGIVIYDSRSGQGYKKTFDYDDGAGKGGSRDIDGNVVASV